MKSRVLSVLKRSMEIFSTPLYNYFYWEALKDIVCTDKLFGVKRDRFFDRDYELARMRASYSLEKLVTAFVVMAVACAIIGATMLFGEWQ